MKTGIATVSISGNLDEKLEAIAAAGFEGIEIFEQDFIADMRSPREIGDLIRSYGLEILLFQPFRDFEGLPEPLRGRAFDRARHKFDLMAELGAPLILVCSSVHPEALGGIDRAAADFSALGDIAAERGLKVGYEALAWGRHVNDHRDAWEIVRRADHAAVGLILDSFHTLARRIDPDTIRRIHGDKIFFVQLADAPMIEMDLLYWSRHFRNMPGEGDLAVTSFMRAVSATGYDGPVSLEIFNDQFRGGPPKAIARDGHRSIITLLDDVRRLETGAIAGLPVLPARVRINGVEFIEFAAFGEDRDRLAGLLESMGFQRSGRHISKDVDLWTQGSIRIVVNADQDGFARTFWNANGIGVCDRGLKVSSVADANSRAMALGAEPFSQPLGPGELDIPAIRGVGGGVMHFIDDESGLAKVWSAEFKPLKTPDGSGAGLEEIDHIAETMSYDEMLSWTLFYSSIFDMHLAPMLDVIDPDGLVRSQAVATPDGRYRLTLNGAETHRTLAGQFLAGSLGSSVQHIAFRSGDIFATASELAARGFEALEMPGNYYDDLSARFALGRDLLNRLQAANVLYDEDDAGAYFQLYGRPFQNGLFFEIVERRDGYSGYGAPNAPFRIAAQKRLVSVKGLPRA
jgi:4-hydroxyphenylpyruvate dioxygenase